MEGNDGDLLKQARQAMKSREDNENNTSPVSPLWDTSAWRTRQAVTRITAVISNRLVPRPSSGHFESCALGLGFDAYGGRGVFENNWVAVPSKSEW